MRDIEQRDSEDIVYTQLKLVNVSAPFTAALQRWRGLARELQAKPNEASSMNAFLKHIALALLLMASLRVAQATNVAVNLSGAQEVPPVTTDAVGTGTLTIGADKSVSGTINTTGISGTVAHVHLAEPGKNGPPIITLTKTSDTEWTVPAGSKLTDEQYAAFKAGKLYVNVHSDAHKAGEIRAQLKP